jgi:DNA-binding NtrC family response regulator
MKILLVEDSPQRLDFFRYFYRDHDVHSATDAAEAVRLLSKEEIDLVHLDYDLADGASSLDVAEYIARHKPNLTVIIHSENQGGVVHLEALLPEATVCPFENLTLKSDDLSRLKAALPKMVASAGARQVARLMRTIG